MKPEIKSAREKAAKAFLSGDANFQSSDFGTALVVAGFSGKLVSIELREVGQGQKQFKRTELQGPQMIGGVVVAEVGEASVTLSLVFENGKTVSLSTLTQHELSTIGDDNAQMLPGKDWTKFIGKVLTCTRSDADMSKAITRQVNDADGKTVDRKVTPRIYSFDVA